MGGCTHPHEVLIIVNFLAYLWVRTKTPARMRAGVLLKTKLASGSRSCVDGSRAIERRVVYGWRKLSIRLSCTCLLCACGRFGIRVIGGIHIGLRP